MTPASPDATVRQPCSKAIPSPRPGYERRAYEPASIDDHPGKARSYAGVARRLRRAGQTEGLVLDVGCGAGGMLRALADEGFTTAGLDHAPEALERARELRGNDPRYTGELRLGDVCSHIPWPDETFDAVVLNDLVEHLADEGGAISEVRRVLRPGGRILVSTLNARGLLARLLGSRWSFYRNPTHLRPTSCRHWSPCWATGACRYAPGEPTSISIEPARA